MKNLALGLLALTTTVFSQEKPKEIQDMFYVTMGSEIPTKAVYGYSKSDRSFVSVGMGIRAFPHEDHGIDVSLSLLQHPLIRMNDVAIGYIYRPQFLGGTYLSVSGYARDEITCWFTKFYRVGLRGSFGYQVPTISGKSSFIEAGLDEHYNLTIRSGLLF